MNSVETNATQSDMTEISAQYAMADAGPSMSQTAVSAPASSTSLNNLEALVIQAQEQVADIPLDNGGAFEKILGAITNLVATLVTLVSSLVGKSSRERGTTTESKSSGATPQLADAALAQSGMKSSSATKASPPSSITSGAGGTSSRPLAAPAIPAKSHFNVVKSDQGMVTVRTLDGFVVRAEGKDQAWSISGPDGRSTRIWGDPHVTESDGDTWDFTKRGTFVFGKNKATVEVVPAGNGQTFSSCLTIYAGDERVTIGGIDTNKPVIMAVSNDGKQHDDGLADGTVYRRKLNQTGEAWTTTSGTKVVVMK